MPNMSLNLKSHDYGAEKEANASVRAGLGHVSLRMCMVTSIATCIVMFTCERKKTQRVPSQCRYPTGTCALGSVCGPTWEPYIFA